MSSMGWGYSSADVGVFTNHQSPSTSSLHLSGEGLGKGAKTKPNSPHPNPEKAVLYF